MAGAGYVAGAGYLAGGAAPYMEGSADDALSEANPQRTANRKDACRNKTNRLTCES